MSDTAEGFEALKHGLTIPQYRDARRIASAPPSFSRTTRAIALVLKYDVDEWAQLLQAAGRIERELASS